MHLYNVNVVNQCIIAFKKILNVFIEYDQNTENVAHSKLTFNKTYS